VYISREAASKETKTALQFHFRYVRNWRQTCATQAPCNFGETLPRVLRKYCHPLFYVATSVYISRKAASKETKTALQFQIRYVKNWRQTCARRAQSNPMGKNLRRVLSSVRRDMLTHCNTRLHASRIEGQVLDLVHFCTCVLLVLFFDSPFFFSFGKFRRTRATRDQQWQMENRVGLTHILFTGEFTLLLCPSSPKHFALMDPNDGFTL